MGGPARPGLAPALCVRPVTNPGSDPTPTMTVRRSTAPCHSVSMPVLRRIGTTMLKGALAAQVWLYRRTQGRLAGSVRGTPVLLLTTAKAE